MVISAKFRLLAAASALAVVTVAVSLTSSAQPASAARPDSRQQAINAMLAANPSGVQISDNAVAWDNGNVIATVPDVGAARAPSDLGSNVRWSQLKTPELKALAQMQTAQAAAPGVAADREGCPGGLTVPDYYCFYQYTNFGGRRVQFTGQTRGGNAADYGFNNGTSSWVSNDVDCIVRTYDGAGTGLPLLWTEAENTAVTNVGSAVTNRLSSWTCT